MWLRRKKTILIVDDEEDFGFFVKANLEARGSYRVRIATSSEQGIVFITFFAAFFPVVVSTIHAMDSMPKVWEEAAQTMGAGRMSLLLMPVPMHSPRRSGLRQPWRSRRDDRGRPARGSVRPRASGARPGRAWTRRSR